jgi:hypothetical protein
MVVIRIFIIFISISILVFIPSLLFWIWILEKKYKIEHSKYITWLLTIITTPIISLLICFAFSGISNFYISKTKFDKVIWTNDDPITYDERRKMISDLIDNELLKDKQKNEIVEILGQPSWIDTTATGKTKELNYTVRISYGFDIFDPRCMEYLVINIDTNTNKVKEIIHKINDNRNLLEKLFTN